MAAKQEMAEDVFPADVDRVVNDKIAAAVSSALAFQRDEITATIMAQLAQTAGAQVPAGDGGVFAGLAMAIAQLTDQGTGRKRIAPEVVVAREEAKVRLDARILKAQKDREPARYKLRAKVFLDEVFIDPSYIDNNHRARPTEIEWPGIPNEAMDPANDTAREIYAEFAAWIGAVKKPDFGEQKLTSGGLVIVQGGGRGRNPRPSGAQPTEADLAEFEAEHVGQAGYGGQGLKVHGRGGAGPYVEKRILGTVAEPAREQT